MLGGLAVLVGLGGGLWVSGVTGPQHAHFARLVPSSLLLLAGFSLVGLLDDLRGLPILPRLAAEFLVSLIALLLLTRGVVPTLLPPSEFWPGIASSALAMTMLANAFNMTDNSDGLAAGTGVITFLGLAGMLLPTGWGAVALATAGALGGFLFWNRPPARIYLGDLGSLPVGALLGLILMGSVWHRGFNDPPIGAGQAGDVLAIVLVLGYTLLDPVCVLWDRLSRGVRPWVGGQDHAAHDLRRLLPDWPTTLALILGVQAFSVAVGLLHLRISLPSYFLAIGILPWIVLLGAARRGARLRRGRPSHEKCGRGPTR